MEILTLLNQARHEGMEIVLQGERLVVRGPRRAEELARQILACKAEVVVVLRPARPIEGEAAASVHGASAGKGEKPSSERCKSCAEGDFVRPRAGGTWRCARCMPYELPGDAVEWWPRVGGPFAPLEALLGLDRTPGLQPGSIPFHTNEFGSKIEVQR